MSNLPVAEPNVISDLINRTVSAAGALLRPQNDIINVNIHNERKDFILKMELLEHELKTSLAAVADVIRLAQSVQKQELCTVETLLQTDSDFTVTRKAVKKPEPILVTKTDQSTVKLGDFQIKANVVHSFDKVLQ